MIYDEIKDVVSRRIKLHIEDDFGTQKCWDEEIEILSRDISKTITFIENECDDEIFYWISEIFEDVVEITQSKEFITAIKKRAEKMIDEKSRNSVETDIRYAEYKIDSD